MVYQQIISGVKSINSTSVQRFVHVSTQVIELACPILMYTE